MKKFLYTLFFISFFAYSVEPTTSVISRCFVSENNKIKMRMLWVISQGWSSGYFQYGNKTPKIPVVQVKRTEEFLTEGRPPAVEVKLLEIVNEDINGEYLLQYQGAIMYVIYINKKGKRFIFKQTEYSYGDCFTAMHSNN